MSRVCPYESLSSGLLVQNLTSFVCTSAVPVGKGYAGVYPWYNMLDLWYGLLRTECNTYPQLPAILAQCAYLTWAY